MPVETHDLGHLYVHGMKYPADGLKQWPVIDRGTSHEVEQPWRIGRCTVIRLPFSRRALVVGWWGRGRSFEELLEAEDSAERDTHEPLTVETMRTWQAPDMPETTDSPFQVNPLR